MKHKIMMLLAISTGLAIGQSVPADYDSVLKTLGKQGDYKDSV